MAPGATDGGFYDRVYDVREREAVRDFYRRWAASYDEELTALDYAQPVRATEALIRLLPDRDSRILDVGCGTGLSGTALGAAGYTRIDGGDFSPEMLARARATGVYTTLHEIDLNGPLGFGDDSYDAVTAVGCFGHGHVDPAALDELVRVVRPGGALVIAVNGPYYDESDLVERYEGLVADGRIESRIHEHGAHMPGRDVHGWVLGAVVS